MNLIKIYYLLRLKYIDICQVVVDVPDQLTSIVEQIVTTLGKMTIKTNEPTHTLLPYYPYYPITLLPYYPTTTITPIYLITPITLLPCSPSPYHLLTSSGILVYLVRQLDRLPPRHSSTSQKVKAGKNDFCYKSNGPPPSSS